jgi:hypothetical protein
VLLEPVLVPALRRVVVKTAHPEMPEAPDAPYDQISPERRTILDVTGQLGDEGRVGVLGFALAQRAARDDTNADPQARRAANTAMDEIDAMLAELYAMRSRLVTEIRASDDATAARVDAMLAAAKAASA